MVAACQTAGHDGGHRPGDHGPVVVREALVVADGAAVAADPGEGALHHPAARQHLEGVGQAPADDVDPKAQGGSRPDHQLARVAGVGPDQPDAALRDPQSPQQRLGAVAVLDAGGGDHDRQQQPQGVHGDVAFAAVDLLAGVEATAGLGDGVGGADRLGVDDRRAGLRLAAGVHADLVAEGVVDVVQGAVGGPAGKEPVDGAPGWEVGWQRPPHTAVVDLVADGVDHFPAGVGFWPAAGGVGAGRWRQQRLQQRPLGVGGVGGVASPALAGLGGCGGGGDRAHWRRGSWSTCWFGCPSRYQEPCLRRKPPGTPPSPQPCNPPPRPPSPQVQKQALRPRWRSRQPRGLAGGSQCGTPARRDASGRPDRPTTCSAAASRRRGAVAVAAGRDDCRGLRQPASPTATWFWRLRHCAPVTTPPPPMGLPQVFIGVLVSVLPCSVSVSRPEPSPTTTLGPSLPSASTLPALTLFCSLSHCAAAAMPIASLTGLPQSFTGALVLVLPITTLGSSPLSPCLSPLYPECASFDTRTFWAVASCLGLAFELPICGVAACSGTAAACCCPLPTSGRLLTSGRSAALASTLPATSRAPMIAPMPAARLVQIFTLLVLLDTRSGSRLGTGSFVLRY